MTARKDFVQTYIEGFRRSDHAMVLGCLADDVVWEIYGHTTFAGDLVSRLETFHINLS
jgi:uncharacterized protein